MRTIDTEQLPALIDEWCDMMDRNSGGETIVRFYLGEFAAWLGKRETIYERLLKVLFDGTEDAELGFELTFSQVETLAEIASDEVFLIINEANDE